MNSACRYVLLLLLKMTSYVVQVVRLPAAVGIVLSLLLGAGEGRSADAPGSRTTVLPAEGDNALSATVQPGSDEAWSTITVRLPSA